MPKTLRNVYFKKLTFENLINAHYRAILGKRDRKETLLFEMDLETNIANLYDDLLTNNYKLGKYRTFTIYEPKERIIKSLPYRDRIVHQWYVEEFIKPIFIPKFIKDTYACINDRGTHLCYAQTQKYMRHMQNKYGTYYILKGDIKKYFYSINKDILLKILKKTIKDENLLELTKKLIYDDGETKGIPIGNYTSQYFANIYLSELDYFVKHKLHIKYYLRFMDDFVLLLPTKNECQEVLAKIRTFLTEELDLELNQKTRYYPNKFGCNFCGYVIHEHYTLLRRRCIINIKRKMRKHNLNLKDFYGHLKHANCYNFVQKIQEECNRLDKLSKLEQK